MKCNEVRKKLSPYLDNELDQVQMESIGDHLNECSICLKEFNLLKETDTWLKASPREEPSKEFHEKLFHELEALSMPVDTLVQKRSIWSTLFRPRKDPWTMDAFEDFPPWSVGNVYLKLINQNQ